MGIQHIEDAAIGEAPARLLPADRAKISAALCAAGLGLLLVYVCGFAQVEAIHNGAHDSRHSAGFPCH